MEKQIKINFNPVKHEYTDDNGLVYTSVTTVIGKYKKPFNRRYWSMYTALRDSNFHVIPDKHQQTIQVDGVIRTLDDLYNNPIKAYEVSRVIRKWKELTERACKRGNEIHDFLEDNINESKEGGAETNKFIKPHLGNPSELLKIATVHDLDKTAVKDRFPKIYKTLLFYINNGCILYAEKRIYSTTYQIAGMIDVLIVKGKQFAILDWKTNKDEMLFQSGYYKKEKVNGIYIKTTEFKRTNNKLLYPINDVPECKGMIYSLQLSLYAFIMELWGYKLISNGLMIYHLRPALEPKLIQIRYMKEQIHKMLQHHYQNRVINNNKEDNIFKIS